MSGRVNCPTSSRRHDLLPADADITVGNVTSSVVNIAHQARRWLGPVVFVIIVIIAVLGS